MISKTIQTAIDSLARLPGIGPRQAARIVFSLINGSKKEGEELARAIAALGENIRTCPVCFASYEMTRDGQKTCLICANPARQKTALCVVEREMDIETIEKTKLFKGVYHVVGEQIDTLAKTIPPTVKRLLLRIAFIYKQLPLSKQKEMEVILATNATVEGDVLASYLEKHIAPLGAAVPRLARDLASGAELEYADTQTLLAAFENRKPRV